MKIAVSAGHNVYINGYFDPGAVRQPYVEADITKETVRLLISLLRNEGHEVLDCTPYNQKFSSGKDHHVARCKEVDKFNADIYVDIHVNAGGGTGVEVLVHNLNSKSVQYAKRICDNIAKDLDVANRGVKAKPGFWSVSLTSKPAMIVEGAFIDNKSDMDKLTPQKYAKCIAEGILNKKLGGNVMTDKNINNPSKWAKKSWDKAVAQNINDGIGPKNVVTEEQLMVFFDRLGLLNKGDNK